MEVEKKSKKDIKSLSNSKSVIYFHSKLVVFTDGGSGEKHMFQQQSLNYNSSLKQSWKL
jgi:hypothetical protein